MSTNSSEIINTAQGIILVELSGQEFCINIQDVFKILNPSQLDQPDIYSVIYPHLTIDEITIPILNLHKYYGLKEESETEDTRILVIQTDYKLFAFFVERVKEICTIGMNFKDELHFLPYTGKLFLHGILKHENRSLYMPDFQKIAKDQFLCS